MLLKIMKCSALCIIDNKAWHFPVWAIMYYISLSIEHGTGGLFICTVEMWIWDFNFSPLYAAKPIQMSPLLPCLGMRVRLISIFALCRGSSFVNRAITHALNMNCSLNAAVSISIKNASLLTALGFLCYMVECLHANIWILLRFFFIEYFRQCTVGAACRIATLQ